MTRTASQTNFERLNPKVTHYQGYEKLCNLRFGEYLLPTLLFENFNTNFSELEKFFQICVQTMDNLAPRKKKYFR